MRSRYSVSLRCLPEYIYMPGWACLLLQAAVMSRRTRLSALTSNFEATVRRYRRSSGGECWFSRTSLRAHADRVAFHHLHNQKCQHDLATAANSSPPPPPRRRPLRMPRVYPPIEGRQPSATLSPSIVESVAGFTAGVVSTLVVHPFDVVKTRLQIASETATTRRGGSWRVIRTIAQEAASGAVAGGGRQGGTSTAGPSAVVRAFYRGLGPNMLGNSVSWGLYFMWYSNIKDLVRATRGAGAPLRSQDYFAASGLSGVMTAVFTNPIWVIKTRMLSTARNTPGAYRSIPHGCASLYRSEGIRGFYRGLTPSLFGVSHGAVQFMAYEQLKNHWGMSRTGGKQGLTNMDYIYLSAVSKVFAGSITYPYQVVRARLQVYDAKTRYKGATDVVRQVFRKEGLSGFYKGYVFICPVWIICSWTAS